MTARLILEIAGTPASPQGEGRRKVFGSAGGKIGRAPECDWVLDSPYVSRHHATVSCSDGTFHIESVGGNGVAVNDARAMLPPLERRPLANGDRVFIDDFEIRVLVTDSGAETLAEGSESSVVRLASVQKSDGHEPLLPASQEDGALDRFLGGSVPAPTMPARDAAWNHSSGLADHFNPPAVMSASIPTRWGEPEAAHSPSHLPPEGVSELPPLAPGPSAFVSALPAPAARPGSGKAAPDAFSAFLQGAGLKPDEVSPEMAHTLGKVMHCMVQGVIDVLRARAQFKNQFRLPVTQVQLSQNNPLKFAIDAQDALAALLGPRARGYLPPLEAFENAFDDIRFHQLAVLAGMRAGFASMLGRFDPQKLQEQAERRSPGMPPWLGAKGRYWDHYVDLFDQLTRNTDAVFQRVYGEEFSAAYEQQLEELRRNRFAASGRTDSPAPLQPITQRKS